MVWGAASTGAMNVLGTNLFTAVRFTAVRAGARVAAAGGGAGGADKTKGTYTSDSRIGTTSELAVIRIASASTPSSPVNPNAAHRP
jgi:hypothetical protein